MDGDAFLFNTYFLNSYFEHHQELAHDVKFDVAECMLRGQ